MSVKEERDEMGQTALHRAVAANDLSLVAQLLSQDPPADVNAVDRDGWTPLHHAISLPNLLLIFALLEREEIELNLVSRDGSSIVHYLARFSPSLLSCSKQEYEDTMDRLFEKLKAKGANMSFSNTNGETPLHQAIMRGLDYVVKWLLELGANVNAANISGDTPLHYAIQVQRLDIIEQLLAKGADKHICNKDGKTPLALARDTSINIFARLCNVSPAEAAKRMDGTVDEYGQTPLHKAAFDGRDDQVFQLLYQGADVNCLDRNGWTPLHNAANNRHLDVALLLLGASSINVNMYEIDDRVRLTIEFAFAHSLTAAFDSQTTQPIQERFDAVALLCQDLSYRPRGQEDPQRVEQAARVPCRHQPLQQQPGIAVASGRAGQQHSRRLVAAQERCRCRYSIEACTFLSLTCTSDRLP